MADSLTRGLVRLLARPVAAADRARAVLHLIDWAGCAAIGATEPAGAILRQAGGLYGAGPCAVAGGCRLAPAGAAFVNGGLGNILEMDDIHRSSMLHPGPVVIPAALAAAEARGAGGPALLEAIVRGYEAVIRVGQSVGPGHYALWHNSSTCGPFGAAAAVAALAGLDEDATVWALGNAGTQAAGPWRCRHERVMSKQLHTARAAAAGLAAAELAALGFPGPDFILEGEQGFWAAMCPDPDRGAVLRGPDDPWRIHDTSFKPWPACRHVHAALEAAVQLGPRFRAEGASAAIRVETYADALRFCDRPAPATPHEAKFSLQHAVATALLGLPQDLSAFLPAAIARPEVAALRARVAVAATAEFSGAYPERYGARLRLALPGGEAEALIPTARGDPARPVSEAELEAKARMLMQSAGWDAGRIARCLGAARALADGARPAPFTAALCGDA